MHDREQRDSRDSGLRKPYVVKRREIPVAADPEGAALELRPFLANPLLASALSSSGASLSWLELGAGEDVERGPQPRPGLLIILRGTAEFFGRTRRGVEQGDVITLPTQHEYRIRATMPDGLEALHVMFGHAQTSEAPAKLTLANVLARNEERLRAWLETPYFRMLRDGTLSSKRMRDRFMQCIRVFSDTFQTFLFTRQAMCRDDDYHLAFVGHLTEEFGHNKLLKPLNDPRVFTDPSLQATLSWFCHQMLVLDNAGKAIVNLVLETGGYHFHNIAKPVFSGDDVQGYFDTHAEDDEQHKDLALELLEGQPSHTYVGLLDILEQSWDMLGATTQRIFELVHFQETST